MLHSELSTCILEKGLHEPLLSAIKKRNAIALHNLSESGRIFLACMLSLVEKRTVLYIAPNETAALRILDDCGTYLSGRTAFLPSEDVIFTRSVSSHEAVAKRLESILKAKNNEIDLLVTTVEALQTRLPNRQLFDENTLKLFISSSCQPHALMNKLVKMGFERVDMVEGKRQCALRGEIIDVFSPSQEFPYRIEFFDEEVDSLRTFDLVSQRSIKKLENIEIPPAEPFLFKDEAKKEVAEKLRKQVRQHVATLDKHKLLSIDDDCAVGEQEKRHLKSPLEKYFDDAYELEQGFSLPNAHLWAGVLQEDYSTVAEWLNDPIVLFDTPETIITRANEHRMGFEEDFKYALQRLEVVPMQEKVMLTFGEIKQGLKGQPILFMQDFLRQSAEVEPDITLSFPISGVTPYASHMKELCSSVQTYKEQGKYIVLLAGGTSRAQRLQKALAELDMHVSIATDNDHLEKSVPLIFKETLSKGFIFDDGNLAVIADSDIFGAGYKKTKSAKNAGERIEAFTDLKVGDYVVHEANGIGIFNGITRLQTEGTYRDYLLIQYKANDKLYVPIDHFDRVQKYIGSVDTAPPLNSLSGKTWEKQKEKVRAGLQKLAFDLVELYAKRKTNPGFAFSPDTPWQRQFEDYFPYELTSDQEKAVQDITSDMENPINMDRLLCGDVGYGKTEVALRAAFKAVMDGKQVAILAPTTILAQQHFYTLQKRLHDFPVNVDVLSRFRTPGMQRDTIAAIREGKVDVVVGTHRLLSKDVTFSNLGLLIVDEEQRFGVRHKESIKNIKESVDVLTLSATPIPRTLHMSMVGVRDMSLLQTPPEERLPVQTYVMDYNDGVIRDAIRREINRKGQVYFLYNRVQSIEEFSMRIRQQLPEAKVVVAHGQMKEHKLEDIMLDFYNGKFDVLLSTTIIESGLDVPNANTLIVYDADRFGLSQLYQLRGRVGRSNRIAYAYFTVRPDNTISEDAQKRLNAIREFTEFGSGFRIAMRDLEIRGSGNIFGPEQSGNIAHIGYDLYVKMIEEAVRNAQDTKDGKMPSLPLIATKVDLKIDAFLPPEYVQGEVQRMEVYKRISFIKNREHSEEVIEELIDRFGDPPVSVMHLIDIALLKSLASRLGVVRVTYVVGILIMRVEPALLPAMDVLLPALQKTSDSISLSNKREPAILLKMKKEPIEHALSKAVAVIEKLVEHVFSEQEGEE